MDNENRAAAGERVTRCDDGKYRWVYEVNLFTDPTIFLLVWKIFFFIFLGVFGVIMISDAVQWSDFYPDRLLYDLKFLGYFLFGMTTVVGIACLIYAAVMGGKYCVLFEMDEKGVNHQQTPRQAKKARKLAAVTALAGAASGNLTAAGVGMNAARTEMYSEFSKVRKVKAYPRRHLIKVNGLLEHNQVYAAKEDFAFVRDYIVSHCGNLKEKQDHTGREIG